MRQNEYAEKSISTIQSTLGDCYATSLLRGWHSMTHRLEPRARYTSNKLSGLVFAILCLLYMVSSSQRSMLQSMVSYRFSLCIMLPGTCKVLLASPNTQIDLCRGRLAFPFFYRILWRRPVIKLSSNEPVDVQWPTARVVPWHAVLARLAVR